MIKLSNRLQAIADFVPQGSKVADVGTDHGFIPCWLAENNITEKAYACDINELPLSLAKKNIEENGLSEQVESRLGNGLAVMEPGEVDVVVIAGMGGSLMLDILDAAPRVVDRLKRVILQPNINAEAVRIWAEKNRWMIVDEELVKENDRFSMIIVMEPGRSLDPMSAVELYLGPVLLKKQHPLLGLYISEEWEKAQKVLEQLSHSDSEESRKKERMIKQKWDDVNGVMKCRLGLSLS